MMGLVWVGFGFRFVAHETQLLHLITRIGR